MDVPKKTILVHKCDENPFIIKSVQCFTAQALYLHASEKVHKKASFCEKFILVLFQCK